ncbi:hypothetical protein D4764_0249200 [Takifugu flavidus]|uniref:Fibronectin type-III domain-containing protein n=1 Tax=Takifugu flavidus TaxID=433684 RepID=A0A5C6MF37_9TELE|nr:hypothetical protein D4764_0249200 [Takifugu flavidus]
MDVKASHPLYEPQQVTHDDTNIGSLTQIKVYHTSLDSLSLCWTPPAGEVKKYMVTCRKGQEIVQELTTTDPHITVTDLEPKEFYDLEVSADCSYHTSLDSLSLRWTPPAGEVKKYLVTCRKGQEIVQELTTTDPHITVTDLEPEEFYNLEVSAEFVNGRISKPAMTIGWTRDDRPTNVTVHRVSQYSLLMLWTPPAGEVKKYMVTCREGQEIVQELTTTAHHITVTDLEPEVIYYLEVSAEFVNGRISKPARAKDHTLPNFHIHPSIHPLCRLSGVGSRGQQPKERSPDFPLPSYLLQLIRRDPQAFPGQSRDIVSPTCPGSPRGSLTGGTCPEHLTREASRGHPD